MAFLNVASIPDGDLVRVFPVDSAAPGDSVVDLRSFCLDHGHGVGHVRTVAGVQSLDTSHPGGLVFVYVREAVPFALLQDHRGRSLLINRWVGRSPPQQPQR